MAESWDLVFLLPNLDPPLSTPFQSDGYVMCSGRDARLRRLADSAANRTALKMLGRFRTARGQKYRPGCFLIRADIPVAERDAETIRAFRNLSALATLTATYAQGLEAPHAVQWRVSWSDQFLFGYYAAGRNGSVVTLNGAARGLDHAIPSMQPDAQFGDPTKWSLDVDQPLLERLLSCWRRCYLQRMHRGKLRRLFRSLEVAFHAALFPADGLTSINDVGTRIALWVSALEILCHPGGSVNKREVQQWLAAAPFSSKEMTRLRYTISFQKKKLRATLPEALYDDVYWARNQFLHGMPVKGRMLHYRQSTAFAHLTHIAPVLFNVALLTFLQRLRIAGGPIDLAKLRLSNLEKHMHSRQGLERVQDGLAAAARRV
jgi:hypothetical protein